MITVINRIIDDITLLTYWKSLVATSSLIIVTTQCNFKMSSWNAKIKKKDLLSNFYFNIEEDFYDIKSFYIIIKHDFAFSIALAMFYVMIDK